MPVIQSPKKQIRRPVDRRHAFAAHIAIDQGILCVCQYAPVLDVGCNNPYDGMWRWLKRIDYRGQYVGVDDNIPGEVHADFRNDIFVRQCRIDGARLPFPPSERHKIKEYSTAFCIGTMDRIKDRDMLMLEMRRIAAQVIVIGGASVEDFRRWGCQYIGLEKFGPHTESWGMWLNDWAYNTRSRIDNSPGETSGYFGSGEGITKKMLFNCSRCGVLDYGGSAGFKCGGCGCIN